MKTLIVALLLTISTAAQAGLRPAPKAYQQSLKHIINDIDSEVESYIGIERFGFVYSLVAGTPEDTINKVVNELVRKGYTVHLDFPIDGDGDQYTRIEISWDDTSVVKR